MAVFFFKNPPTSSSVVLVLLLREMVRDTVSFEENSSSLCQGTSVAQRARLQAE